MENDIGGSILSFKVMIWAIVIGFIVLFFVFHRVRGSQKTKRVLGQKKLRTQEGLAIARSLSRTGLTVNDNPQMQVEADVMTEDGSTFPCTVRKILPLQSIVGFVPGTMFSVLYDPNDRENIVWNDNPDPERLFELTARYNAARHPSDLTFEQRLEIQKHGVEKKARLDDLRLTGREEAGDYEATAVIRITDDARGDIVAKRTLFLNEHQLNGLTVGKYIDVRILPSNPDFFTIIQSVELHT